MNLFSGLRNRMEQRSRYRRTLAELESMPQDTARDLDIAPSDVRKIALKAVYG